MIGLRSVTIGKKLTGAVVLLVVLISAGVGIMSFIEAYRAIHVQMQTNIPQMAKYGAMAIGNKLNYYLGAMEGVASRHVIRSMDWEQQQKPAIEFETRRLGFQGMGIITPDGQAKYADGTTASLGDRDYFKQAMAGKTVFSDVIISRVTNAPVMIIAAPIKGSQDKPAAVLIGRLGGEWLCEITDQIRYGENGYSYIIDSKGVLIAHANRKFVTEQKNFIEEAKTKPEYQPLAAMFQRMNKGETGFDEYPFMGADRFFGFTPIPGTTWSLAVGAHKADVFRKVTTMRQNILLVAIAFVMVGIILMVLLTRRLIVTPLNRFQEGLTGFFQFLNRQRSDVVPIAILSRDEIGSMAEVINANMEKTRLLFLHDHEIAKQNLRTMEEVESAVKRVQHGFYNSPVETLSDQESFLLLVNNFNRLVSSTREQFENISRAMLSFAESNFTIRLQVGHASGSMGGLISSINTLGISVSELMSFIFNVGSRMEKSAENLNKMSGKLKNSSQEQSRAIAESTGAIRELASNIEMNFEKVESLRDQAKQMKSIVSAIRGIAEQTDLLALNATIEAARAGDHGKGFAVVSGEVKALALQTKDALHQINDTINAVIATVDDVAQRSGHQQEMVVALGQTSDQLFQINETNLLVGEQVSSYAEDVQVDIDNLVATSRKATTLSRPMDQICDMEFVFEITSLKMEMINYVCRLTETIASDIAATRNFDESPLKRWIHTSGHRNFTDTKAWRNTIKYSADLDEKIRTTAGIVENQKDAFDHAMEKVMEIETLMDKLFDSLDRIKTEECLKRETRLVD